MPCHGLMIRTDSIDLTISVTITNKTGGKADVYQVAFEALPVESRRKNNWNRSEAGAAIVTFVRSGTKFETALSALDVVYGDTHNHQSCQGEYSNKAIF
ncbi:hypothetical protein CCMSSC00406_0009014 [Pleurotus cornucopiae]|uniref:Uncharacterized protein n=1 Tax=Pleurotus cornucopiae TaxID=5321 RepID=A0ACB7IVD1_PLECO|nr:hypothetical protein CCMSSC00406_0009014 [Pleurotus cornucopiae]